VLDEPTATLDPLASRDILELVQRAKARNKAVLFSTHRMEEAEYLCDRLVFMRGGRVAAEGPTADVLTPDTIRSVFGVSARVFHEPFSNAMQVAFRN
jgi:iron complex transport system ATP-binding protein